jgi:hypothetical protein
MLFEIIVVLETEVDGAFLSRLTKKGEHDEKGGSILLVPQADSEEFYGCGT